MSQSGLGGSRWMEQSIYGFDVMWGFFHGGLFTPDEKMVQPASPARPFSDAASRFDARAKAPGRAHGEPLRIDAIDQVEKGRLGPPRRLVSSDGSLLMGADRVNAAFRFAVTQMDKSRACGDLKYGCVNLSCPDFLSHLGPRRGNSHGYFHRGATLVILQGGSHGGIYIPAAESGRGRRMYRDHQESSGWHPVRISPHGIALWSSRGGASL